MPDNSTLRKAKKEKNDEFYTLYEDVEKEVKHYWKQLKGKIVYCNCDDPKYSNFWKYFYNNFNDIGLKELKATYKTQDGSQSYLTVYDGIRERRYQLDGDGAFQSPECYEIMKQSDVIITNPPFSQFRTFFDQLIETKKDFLIIGNTNAITYKNVFPFIKKNYIGFGYLFSKTLTFRVPDSYNKKYCKISCTFYTTLNSQRNKEKLIPTLNKKYNGNEDMYPKYDNYDAINVDKISQIPSDYYGVMGVPITFLGKYNPDEFEIISFRKGIDGKDLVFTREREREFNRIFVSLLKGYHTNKNIEPVDILFPQSMKIGGLMNNPKDTKINGRSTYARILIKRK